jgi:hypothetical protein
MKRRFPTVEGARKIDKITGAAKLTEAHTRFIEAIADTVIDRVMPKGKKKRPKADRRGSSG